MLACLCQHLLMLVEVCVFMNLKYGDGSGSQFFSGIAHTVQFSVIKSKEGIVF